MMQSSRLLWVVAILALIATEASGQEWSRFRGRDGAGSSDADSIPTEWTSRDYVWRIPLSGIGHSSPVVWGDYVYVSSATQDDAQRYLCCIDATDGHAVWQRTFPSPTFDLGNATAFDAATPVVDEQRVYIVWANPKECILQALDRRHGKTIWQRDMGPIDSEHGFGTSPILYEDSLIQLCDNKGSSWLAALDCKTGQTRWKVERTTVKTTYSTPLIYYPAGGNPQLITVGWGPGFTAYDPQSGRQLWQLPLFQFRSVGSPLVAGGLVFAAVGTGGRGRQMFAVRPGDSAKGTEAEVAYEITQSMPYVPTPIAHDNLLFIWGDSGVVQCIDVATGTVHWRERVGGNYYGSPVRVNDRLYCISRDGVVTVLAAARQFQVLAQNDLEEPSHSTPAIAGGKMFLRTFTHLMAVGE